MNKRIIKKTVQKWMDSCMEIPFSVSGMKKAVRSCAKSPYSGRFTGKGMRKVYYYKSIGAFCVYTSKPKFRIGDRDLPSNASACCLWWALSQRQVREDYLNRQKCKEKESEYGT